MIVIPHIDLLAIGQDHAVDPVAVVEEESVDRADDVHVLDHSREHGKSTNLSQCIKFVICL